MKVYLNCGPLLAVCSKVEACKSLRPQGARAGKHLHTQRAWACLCWVLMGLLCAWLPSLAVAQGVAHKSWPDRLGPLYDAQPKLQHSTHDNSLLSQPLFLQSTPPQRQLQVKSVELVSSHPASTLAHDTLAYKENINTPPVNTGSNKTESSENEAHKTGANKTSSPNAHNYVFQMCLSGSSYQPSRVQILRPRNTTERGFSSAPPSALLDGIHSLPSGTVSSGSPFFNSLVTRVATASRNQEDCFLWPEWVPYDFISLPRYIYLPRMIEYTVPSGLKKHLPLHCFVNPWVWFDKQLVAPHEALCFLNVDAIKVYKHLNLRIPAPTALNNSLTPLKPATHNKLPPSQSPLKPRSLALSLTTDEGVKRSNPSKDLKPGAANTNPQNSTNLQNTHPSGAGNASSAATDSSTANGSSRAQNLWIDDLKLNITNRRYATHWNGRQIVRNQSIVDALSQSGLKLDQSEQPSHLPLHINIAFRPYTDLGTASLRRFPLVGGAYRVWAYVVASDFGYRRQERRILNPLMEPKIAQFVERDGTVRTSIQTLITELVEDGNYHLLLRIQPINTPQLKTFEAVYNFATEWQQLVGSKTPTLEEEAWHSSFKFNDYLKTIDNHEDVQSVALRQINYKPSEKYKYSTYEYGTLEMRFQRIKPGETATIRTVELRAKVCLTYTHSGKPVRHRDFMVQKIRDHRAGQKTQEGRLILLEQEDPSPAPELVASDAEGCLVWRDEIRHRYYMPEKYIFPRVQIQDPDLDEAARELTLVVNPWDEKWTFGHDRRDLPKNYLDEVEKGQKAESRFYLTRYDYQTLRFRYHIDNYMNLMVRKTVLLSLMPRVLRYSSIVWGRRATEWLRDGVYLMKVAYQKDFLDPSFKGLVLRSRTPVKVAQSMDEVQRSTPQDNGAVVTQSRDEAQQSTLQNNDVELQTAVGSELQPKQYITAVRKLVRVQDGRIITPIELGVRDLRLMKIRSNFLIQLETIDEKALLESVIFKKKLHEKLTEHIKNSNKVRNLPQQERQDLLKHALTDRFSFLDDLHKLVDVTSALDQNIKSLLNAYSGHHLKPQERSTQNIQMALDQSQSITTDGFIDLLYKDLDVTDRFKQDLSSEIDNELLEAAKVNDFTMYDVSPFRVSLDHLIDHDSGLQARTFLGPMTLIFNSTGASMRPTDNLSENDCAADDCNDLRFNNLSNNDSTGTPHRDRERGRYENSKFFGSSRDLKNKSVDELIVQHEKNESQYITYQRAASLLWDFVDFYKLQFVSLSGEPLIQFNPKSPKCRNLHHEGYFDFDFSQMPKETKYPYMDKALYFWGQQGCLQISNVNTTLSNLFLSRFNSLRAPLETRPPNLEQSSFWENLSTENLTRYFKRSQVKPHEAYTTTRFKKIIDKFFQRSHASPEQKQFIDPAQQYVKNLKSEHVFLYRLCAMMSRIYVKNSLSVKAHNKALQEVCYDKVKDGLAHEAFLMDKRYRIRRVTGNYNFKGGKSLNLNIGDDFGLSHVQRISFARKLTAFGSWLGLATGGFASMDWTRVNSRSFSEGTKVSSQTFLVVQTAALDIELGEYEKCLILKWNPHLLQPQKHLVGLFESDFAHEWESNVKLTHEDTHQALLGGLMLCKGEIETTPVAVRERYYYMTQHFTDGDMLDPGDLYNHPWLLRLRGVRDFETFIQTVRAQHIEFIDWGDRFFSTPLHSSWQWPIKKLNETYRYVMPTFPGMYAQTLRIEEEADYPWIIAPNVSYYGTESNSTTPTNSWGLKLQQNPSGHWTDEQIQ